MIESESLAKSEDNFVKESFHDYLRSSTNVFAKNIYSDKDTSSKSLNNLKKYKDIVVLAADKESCAITLNKRDFT